MGRMFTLKSFSPLGRDQLTARRHEQAAADTATAATNTQLFLNRTDSVAEAGSFDDDSHTQT